MKRNNVVRALLEISTKNSMSQWKREVCLNAADLIDAQAQEIETLREQLILRNDELHRVWETTSCAVMP